MQKITTAISGIAPSVFLNYGFGSYQGYIAENFVAQALRANNSSTLYCWQGRTAEVEFLFEKEGEIIRVTQSKSLNVYADRYQPKLAFVLSANNIARRNIRHYLPLYMAGRLAA